MRMPKTAAGTTGRRASAAPATAAGGAGDPGNGAAAPEANAAVPEAEAAAPGNETAAPGAAAPGTAATAAGPGARQGNWRARMSRATGLPAGSWSAATLRVLRRHWLAAALLLAGLILRALTQAAYRPALLYIDSVKYLYNAWPGTDPVGYKVPLKAILLVGNLSTVTAVQHLLGLAMAAVLYLVLLRRGCPRWLAAVAIAPVLLDAYQLQMEQTIMPDVWFEALIVTGLALLLWRPAPGLRTVVAAGLILGSSATLRQVGEILVLPAAVYLAIVPGAWRGRAVRAAALCAAFALPILVYSGISLEQNGHFQLSHSGTSELYGRMAAAADCATLKLPAYQRPLCPTPRQRALGPDGLEHSAASPLRDFAPPAGRRRGKVITSFNHKVLLQQPLRVISGVSRDALKLFALTRVTSAGDTPISRWQFQDRYPTFDPTITVNRQHVIVLGVQLVPNGGISYLKPLPGWQGGNAEVVRPLAAFLRTYQFRGGYTPGPLLAIAAVAGLIGSASLVRRRRRADGAAAPDRQTALACFLFFTAAVAVLLTSDLFEFSWRYQLPALITLPPAGALGIGVILAAIRRGRGKAADGGAPQPQLAAVRTSGAGGTA
jgi:hypothetical protein